MRIFLAAALLLTTPQAFACDIFTSELHEPGGKKIEFDGGTLVLTETGKPVLKIEHGSVGTGISTRYGTAQSSPDQTFSILFASDDSSEMIVLDMEVFRPYCPNE